MFPILSSEGNHMKFFIFILIALSSFSTIADSKLSIDLAIDKLFFQRPPKGVGKAGTLIFTHANVDNNGILLNINNVNNYFDSQIFLRPTFLGFNTQFGNYGFALDDKSFFNSLNQTELQNSKIILDDNQLNLSGEYFTYISPESSIKLKTFRLYCQSPLPDPGSDPTTNSMMTNCFNFLTFNGNFAPNNQSASLLYEGVNNGDKMLIKAQVKSLDIRKTEMNLNVISANTISNDTYFINASSLDLNCAKDEDLKSLDIPKIKKACLNRLNIAPLKVNMIDKVSNSAFNLDIKNIAIKDKIAYLAINNGSLSDKSSTTYIDNILLNCKKELDTDLLVLTQVLRDCISYSRLSISEVKSTKPDKKDSSIKNIILSSTNNALMIRAQVKFLGIKAVVGISGSISLDEAKKQLAIKVTDTKLPLGINSVKLVMYFLKKVLISKSIFIHNNIITIQF